MTRTTIRAAAEQLTLYSWFNAQIDHIHGRSSVESGFEPSTPGIQILPLGLYHCDPLSDHNYCIKTDDWMRSGLYAAEQLFYNEFEDLDLLTDFLKDFSGKEPLEVRPVQENPQEDFGKPPGDDKTVLEILEIENISCEEIAATIPISLESQTVKKETKRISTRATDLRRKEATHKSSKAALKNYKVPRNGENKRPNNNRTAINHCNKERQRRKEININFTQLKDLIPPKYMKNTTKSFRITKKNIIEGAKCYISLQLSANKVYKDKFRKNRLLTELWQKSIQCLSSQK